MFRSMNAEVLCFAILDWITSKKASWRKWLYDRLPPLGSHTHLIPFVLFHFIRSCDGATSMVGRHPCYSQIFNKVASSHLIPRPGSVSGTN